MISIQKYIEKTKIINGIDTDSEIARKLGVSKQQFYYIYNNMRPITDDFCLKLAKLNGDHPERVLCIAGWTMASENAKPKWEAIYHAVNNLFTKKDKQSINKSTR